MNYDYNYKVILIGAAGVGKSSLLTRYIDDKFSDYVTSTIGVDFRISFITLENGDVLKLHFWDTCGQEKYDSISHTYYRGAHAAVLVYDITSTESFDRLHTLLKKLREYCPKSMPLFLIGNKSDQEYSRTVSSDKIHDFMKKYGVTYFETTSAKSSSLVDESFKNLLTHMHNYYQKSIRSDPIGVNLSDSKTINSRKSCCIK